MFEKVMYKVKENTFRIKDFTSGDKVDESKFIETTNQRNKKRLETQVCVLYKDEYNDIKTKLDAHDNEVQHLKAIIEERESQIKRLEKENKEKSRSNIDEVMQLKEDISIMKEDHQKEVSHLHQEKSNLEKTHLESLKTIDNEHASEILELTKAHQDEVTQLNEDISTLKQEHLEKINEKDKSHNDEREKIRSYFLKIITLDNAEDTSEIIELEKSVPSIFKPFMRNHMKQIEDLKERKLLKEPEKIIKTYELSGE